MAIMHYRTRGGRVSPWQELNEVSHRLSRMFDEGGVPEITNGGSWMPAVNVEETRDDLILTADLPGFRVEDVELELENGVLAIRGERQEVREENSEERKVHLWERRYGGFHRSFSLPRTVKADEISARFEDGVLHVRMPKAAEAKGRKIQIGQ